MKANNNPNNKQQQLKNNPTAYFLQQASNVTNEYKDKIAEFQKQLINLNTCVLCKENFDFHDRIPRILVHCGHTFCTACIKNFHKNSRVRCPLCLKLIRNIESIDRLPVNHTIFSKLADEMKQKSKKEGMFQNVHKIDEFTHKKFMAPMTAALQKNNQEQYYQQQQNQQDMQQVDGQDIEWEYCIYHQDRIKHFYCTTHADLCCRLCKDSIHAKQECDVADLYDIEDIQGFLNKCAENQLGESENPGFLSGHKSTGSV